MSAFERQVADESLRIVGPARRVDDLAVYEAIIATRSPRWRFPSMFSATKFVVAGAIVALVGGLLFTGVLTQQRSPDRLPAVGASASASAQAEPTDAGTAEPDPTAEAEADATTTITDLLPGVDLVTEEVEPEVYRVVSDTVRDLVRLADRKKSYLGGILDGNVVAGLDGTVWWFDRDGFYRLGEQVTHSWPEGVSEVYAGRSDIEVGPDGTLWLLTWSGAAGSKARTDISSYDGQTWSNRWRGAYGKRRAFGVEVQQDGTVSMAWFTDKGPPYDNSGPVRAARLGDDGWVVLPGSVVAGGPDLGSDLDVAEAGGSDVWHMSGRLNRHDGESWVGQETPDIGGVMRAAVGPDGTLWVRLHPECGPGSGCSGPSDVLARLDGEDWEVYDSSDGIPMMGDHYQGFEGFFAVAPDRSIWFNPIGDYERTGTECDGIATFDGEAVSYYLRDMCVYAMDIAPDGTAWLQAGEYRADIASGQSLADARPGPIHTYAITPAAMAATE